VNADDFGQSPGVNRGIIDAHERGIVSSASLMVRWPAATEAASYARSHPALGVGLHIDFHEWTYERGRWRPLYEVVSLEALDAVQAETMRQLETFRRLVGRDPTHLDSHQHTHLTKALRPFFIELAGKLGVPLRRCTPDVRYCGDFYGQDGQGRSYSELISPTALIRVLARLRPGFTELGCHPGYPVGLRSMYRRERAREVKALCDPKVRDAVVRYGIALCSFEDARLCRKHATNHA
jgi:chitin disaccharide deacetylase